MTKNKENARTDYINMITKSWTWDRMTDNERTRCDEALHMARLNGRYEQRYETLQDVYYSFLMALDYKPVGWRETEKEVPLF